jgi:alkanesulfonate monooxygenase SsuD/methylene tetrahydromethanopterin reductase-like flavin-dependent oxidoreductase (luciferase family)
VKIGAIMPQQHTPWGELVEVARLVDDCGYDSLWVIDHQLPAASASMAGSQFDAWTVLAAFGMATRRVALLAKIITTVDHISGGRAALGIGAGWFEQEHRAFGWPFPSLRERLERLDEAVQVIRKVWTEEHPSFAGQYYSLDFSEPGTYQDGTPVSEANAPAIGPRPVQQPHPPLIVGGSGERRTLRTVAKHADEWNVSGTPAFIAQKSEVLTAHCEAVGRDPASIARSAYAQVIIDDSRERVDALLERRAALTGSTVEAVRERVIAGSPGEILEQLATYAEVGIGHFMLQVGPPYRPAIIEKVARDILEPARTIS